MKAILTWHSIDASGSVISTPPEVFAAQVDWLTSGRVRVVSLPNLVALPEQDDAVALTFDDGFANFATHAAPRLFDRGLAATLFVVTDRVGLTNDWGGYPEAGIPSLPLLGWSELGHLVEAGVDVGSHSRSHADLGILQGPKLADEVAGSAERIVAELGQRPRVFAYPYGTVSDAATHEVERVFEWACLADLRAVRSTDHRTRLPRIDMYYLRNLRTLDAWGSVTFQAYFAIRQALRGPRQRLRTTLRRRRMARRPAGGKSPA